MNGEQFNTALAKAKPGEHVTYHSGNLMRDRQFIPDVDSVAVAATKANEDGKCLLFQRKVSASVYQYFAVKTKKRG